MSRSLNVHQPINSDNYEYAISLKIPLKRVIKIARLAKTDRVSNVAFSGYSTGLRLQISVEKALLKIFDGQYHTDITCFCENESPEGHSAHTHTGGGVSPRNFQATQKYHFSLNATQKYQLILYI